MLVRFGFLMAFVSCGVLFTGCVTDGRYPLGGAIYHDIKGPNNVISSKAAGSKKGSACASNILGYIALGDASIAAAKKSGGITEVSHIDYQSTNILGIYGTTCTMVRGS